MREEWRSATGMAGKAMAIGILKDPLASLAATTPTKTSIGVSGNTMRTPEAKIPQIMLISDVETLYFFYHRFWVATHTGHGWLGYGRFTNRTGVTHAEGNGGNPNHGCRDNEWILNEYCLWIDKG